MASVAAATVARRTAAASDYKSALAALASLQSNASVIHDWTKRRNANLEDNFVEETMQYARRMALSREVLSKLSVIHVAGTKGKGSTCAFVESILRNATGVKTGLYISPHLVEPTERIRLNGKPISDEMFTTYFWKCWDALEETKTDVDSSMPGFFRFLTLMAFKLFLEEKVDVAIIEVGIGGRSDATNIIDNPVVCGITSLGYDHLEILGNTLDKIAYEKAGIFKKHVPAFTVPQPKEAAESLLKVANTKQTPLYITPSLESFSSISKTKEKLKLGLSGKFQQWNASLALSLSTTWIAKNQNLVAERITLKDTNCWWLTPEADEIFKTKFDSPTGSVLPFSRSANVSGLSHAYEASQLFGESFEINDNFRNGLLNCKWAGRCQTIERGNPEITNAVRLKHTAFFLDGSHTPESTEVCAKWFETRIKKKSPSGLNILVFNCFASRDPNTLLIPFIQTNLFDIAIFLPVSRRASTSAAMNTFSNAPANTKWQETTRSIWLDRNSVAGTPKEESSAIVLDSIEGLMEKLLEIENDVNTSETRRDINVLISGSLHLVGGVLGFFTEHGVKNLL